MLTAEVKMNGKLIKHIYIVNKCDCDMSRMSPPPLRVEHKCPYEYEVYHVGQRIERGGVKHERSDGALALIEKVIASAREEAVNGGG